MRTAKEHREQEEKVRAEVTGKRRRGRPRLRPLEAWEKPYTGKGPKPKEPRPSLHRCCFVCGARQPALSTFRSEAGDLEAEVFHNEGFVRYRGKEVKLRSNNAKTLGAILACKGEVYWEVLASERYPRLTGGKERLRNSFYFDIGRLRTQLREGVGLEGFILLNGSGLVRIAVKGTYGGTLLEEVAGLERIPIAQSQVDAYGEGKNGPGDGDEG